jgi:hypothetical protein
MPSLCPPSRHREPPRRTASAGAAAWGGRAEAAADARHGPAAAALERLFWTFVQIYLSHGTAVNASARLSCRARSCGRQNACVVPYDPARPNLVTPAECQRRASHCECPRCARAGIQAGHEYDGRLICREASLPAGGQPGEQRPGAAARLRSGGASTRRGVSARRRSGGASTRRELARGGREAAPAL